MVKGVEMNKVANTGLSTFARRLLLLGGALVMAVLTGCASTQGASLPMSELESFTPAAASARVMNDVKVRWEVRPDVSEFCGRAAKITTAQAFFTPPVACAVWNVASKECVIITGQQVSHVALGHELRHCFEGNFHR